VVKIIIKNFIAHNVLQIAEGGEIEAQNLI
jgi:hypothetical protein